MRFLIKDFFEEREEIILDLLNNKKSIADISHENLSDLYDRGYYLFTSGRFEDALTVFQVLNRIQPNVAHYWRALGAINQQLEYYNHAIESYDKAIKLNKNDIISYVYRAECKILSGYLVSAVEDFKKVTELGAENPADRSWVKKAKLLIEIHSKK